MGSGILRGGGICSPPLDLLEGGQIRLYPLLYKIQATRLSYSFLPGTSMKFWDIVILKAWLLINCFHKSIP